MDSMHYKLETIYKRIEDIVDQRMKYGLKVGPEFKEILRNYTCVAGGAVRSVVKQEDINDFDIFVTNPFYAFYLINIFRDIFPMRANTENAYTFIVAGDDVQIIIKNFGRPEQVISQFDFNICKGYYNPKFRKIVISDEMKQGLLSKKLIFNTKSTYSKPFYTLARRKKFLKMGYKISIAQNIKILYKLLKAPLKDWFTKPKSRRYLY